MEVEKVVEKIIEEYEKDEKKSVVEKWVWFGDRRETGKTLEMEGKILEVIKEDGIEVAEILVCEKIIEVVLEGGGTN